MNEETKELNLSTKINIRYLIHMMLTILFAAGVAGFSNEVVLEHAWNKQYFAFAGAICAVIVLCSFLERKKLYESFRSMGILLACFLVSGLLLLLSDFYVNLPIWLLGGIAAAALVNRNIGMLYLYYFVYHAIYLQGGQMHGLVFHFVVATLIAFFIPKMKTFLSMLYMMAFAACLVVTGSIIHNQMDIDESMMLDTFYILCTYLFCILVTMVLVKWNMGQQTAEEEAEVLVPGNYEYLDLLAQDTAEKDAAAEADIAEETATEETTETVAEEEITETIEEVAEVKEEANAEIEVTSGENNETNDTVETVEVAEEPVAEETADVTEETEAEETADATEETVDVTEETETEETVDVTEETEAEETADVAEEMEVTAETELKEEPEEIFEEEEEETVEEVIEEIDYTSYCDEKSELLLELRAKNKAVYAQAILVGKLAAETAQCIGLNVELTKAAGLYKRIGKIREVNNEYTSTEIAKEHNFPEPLIYLLDQLNHDIIEQKEAAVILMTDGVISYYSIVRHAQKLDIAPEKIVDMIVSKKIFQGDFNDSGLSMQECVILREKLIALLKAQDKKHAERMQKA